MQRYIENYVPQSQFLGTKMCLVISSMCATFFTEFKSVVFSQFGGNGLKNSKKLLFNLSH